MFGWNPGTEQEIFSLEELIDAFDPERIHKSGARFDFEKALWFNHQYVQKLHFPEARERLIRYASDAGFQAESNYLEAIFNLLKPRLHTLKETVSQGY